MKSFLKPLIAFGIAASIGSGGAHAAVIASVNHSSAAAVLADDPAFSGLHLGIQLGPFLSGEELFEDVNFALGDAGTTFTANAGNDADFLDFVALATNGVDDGLTLRAFGFFVSVAPADEAARYSGPGFNGIDLIGNTIDNVTITLNSISISDFNGFNNNRIQWNSTINFNGSLGVASVPEPSSLVLMGLGFAGLGFGRKRKLA
ncbi:MAG: PEP-CTERM sorting domain-containing protein [Pseudomonadales bacterium]|nr:PEP-CTERM sorting domain-containing protein [Pseudomonadales bacterium]